MSQIGQLHVPRKRGLYQPKLLITKIRPNDEDGDGEYRCRLENDNDNDDDDNQDGYSNENDSGNSGSEASEDNDPGPDRKQVRRELSLSGSSVPAHEDPLSPVKPTKNEPKPEPLKRSLYTCTKCDATFVTNLSLARHNLVFHEDEDEETFQCKSCQKTFDKLDDLTGHTAKEHGEKKPSEKQKHEIQRIQTTGTEEADDTKAKDITGATIEGEEHQTMDEDEGENEAEVGDESDEDLEESGQGNYAQFNMGAYDNDEDEMNVQPVSDPFAEDDDQVDGDGNEEDDEFYNGDGDGDFGDDEDAELDTSQHGRMANGASLSLVNFDDGTDMQFQSQQQNRQQGSRFRTQSLLRTPFNQTQARKTVQSVAGGVQGPKSHICPECGVGFVTKVNMQRHLLSHGHDRPHKCQLCEKGFVRKEHLFKHLSSVHSGLKFTCEFCGKDISRKDHLLRHIRHVHPSEFLRIPPELLNAQNLESLSGENLRAAGFVISDKALNSMQPKPKKPYLNCDMCTATFTLLNDLYNHQSEAHSDIRKYKCPDCPKAFKRKEHLTKHEVLHSGDKKFTCNLCVKSFPRKDALTDHIRRLHEAESLMSMEFPCSYCDKVFLQRQNLLRHLRSVHNITVNIQSQIAGALVMPPSPAAAQLLDPMRLGVGRIAPKPVQMSVGTVQIVSQPIKSAPMRTNFQPQQQQLVRLKPILPQPKPNAALLQAQQHLNKISGGKSSITISAVPSPVQTPRVTPIAPKPPVSVVQQMKRQPAPVFQTARPQFQQVTLANVNKIAIKKIGEFMTSSPTQINATPVATTSAQASPSNNANQIAQRFPCSYCNAVYSDEKIFRIHMNSHNANMN